MPVLFKIPKGYRKVDEIIPRSIERKISQTEYLKLLEEDFEKNRCNYVEIYMYGVPVFIKVEKIDEP